MGQSVDWVLIPKALEVYWTMFICLWVSKRRICVADVLRELKKISSSWVHNEIGACRFAWQDGYAAFTVSATSREAVRHYIGNQEEHHRGKSFREELIEMLKKAEIEYDARYLD